MDWFQIQSLHADLGSNRPFNSCVNLGKSIDVSEPQFVPSEKWGWWWFLFHKELLSIHGIMEGKPSALCPSHCGLSGCQLLLSTILSFLLQILPTHQRQEIVFPFRNRKQRLQPFYNRHAHLRLPFTNPIAGLSSCRRTLPDQPDLSYPVLVGPKASAIWSQTWSSTTSTPKHQHHSVHLWEPDFTPVLSPCEKSIRLFSCTGLGGGVLRETPKCSYMSSTASESGTQHIPGEWMALFHCESSV